MAKPKSDEYRYKVITDPVHGEIGLSQLEVDLINTQSFQRLRRLKQLGLATLVYPSATHSRFSHSLGVFRIMSRAIDLMVRRRKFNNDERRLLRVAALLHDIGHYPHSHLVEYIDRDPHHESMLASKKKRKRARPYPRHEKLGELIITGRKDISSRLKAERIDPADVAAVICGTHPTRRYNQLISSTLDLDRMDYLVRDAMGTGVPFGRVDLHYLLSNLDIDRKGNLVLHKKAATAAEHFVVARYFMSKTVYLHKTVFGFEALMRRTLSLLRDKGKLWKDGDAIEKLVLHPADFLGFHDGMIDRLIEQYAEKEAEDSTLGQLCRALRDRKPPRLVLEVSSLTPKGGSRTDEMTRFVARRKDQLQSLAKTCGIPLECWLWEDPKDISFEKFGPLMTLAEAASGPPDEASELIYLIDDDGKTVPLIEDKSSILHHLSSLRLQMARLYVVEEDKAKITKAERAVKAWLKP